MPPRSAKRARVVLEAQHAAAVQQVVLRLHNARQIVRQQRAVVEDRRAGQSFSVAGGQSRQVLDQQLQRLAIGANTAAGVDSRPFARDFFDDVLALGHGPEMPVGSAPRNARVRAAVTVRG